jgi:putative ABC transport system substrate-binding protein
MIPRRTFIAGLGAAAAWPLAARAQQPLPVVGYLSAGSPESAAKAAVAFRKGLAEIGYIEGQSVAIEYRWAEGKVDRLPELAADLARRRVAVIVTPNSNAAAEAAKAATATIPIVFSIGGDPVQLGLVPSFNRPAGNLTGMSFLATDTVAKMLEALHEVTPRAALIAALVNPNNPTGESDAMQAEEAARILGLKLIVLNAANEHELDEAFKMLVQRRAEALLIEGDPLFTTRLKQLVVLTARHAIPAIFQGRDFPDAGGLMSYGADRNESTRQAGIYVGRILKGEKPADLPIQLSTKVELVLNLSTAKALGLTVPPSLLATANEVIE